MRYQQYWRFDLITLLVYVCVELIGWNVGASENSLGGSLVVRLSVNTYITKYVVVSPEIRLLPDVCFDLLNNRYLCRKTVEKTSTGFKTMHTGYVSPMFVPHCVLVTS